MKRFAAAVAVVLATYFAVEGGEYSTSDLVRQRAMERAMRARIDSLQHDLDSLRTLRRRIATDAALQERIAREENSMVKNDKELVYRFVEPERSGR
jgi:hypothetical protein